MSSVAEDTNVNVVWKPLPGSQELAISCPADVLLYEGSRGGGKTDCSLMAFAQYVGIGYGAFWRGIYVDTHYKSLDDVIAKSLKYFPQIWPDAEFLRAKSDYRWRWKTGEELLFRHMANHQDYLKIHGSEFSMILINEVTKMATPQILDDLMTCNRSSFIPTEHTPRNADGSYNTPDGKPLPEIPLKVFMTTNPFGPGRNWVKKRFIDVAAPGKIVENQTEVYNPRTKKKETITKTQVRLFSSYRENPYLSPEYVATLESISDPVKRSAWLQGDWSQNYGSGAVDDIWNNDIHVLEEFNIPEDWKINRSFDHGSSAPFVCQWYAQSNGEDVDGSAMNFPAGTIIMINEWYGSKEIGTNKGIRLSSTDIAKGIREREEAMVERGLIQKIPNPGPADNSIWTCNDSAVKSIAKLMEENGVSWTRSNKAKGTRVNGLELIRAHLQNSKDNEGPGLYFFRSCQASIQTIPALPRCEKNPDDVDTKCEDHCYDALRYRVLDSAKDYATKLQVRFPT